MVHLKHSQFSNETFEFSNVRKSKLIQFDFRSGSVPWAASRGGRPRIRHCSGQHSRCGPWTFREVEGSPQQGVRALWRNQRLGVSHWLRDRKDERLRIYRIQRRDWRPRSRATNEWVSWTSLHSLLLYYYHLVSRSFNSSVIFNFRYKLDKNHTFIVCPFTDFQKYEALSDDWRPPQPQPYPYTQHGNLGHYLLEPDCRDQFVVTAENGRKVWKQ